MSKGTFPFDPEAFLVGTADMTCSQVGAYIRLLCYQWEKGGLPDDDSILSGLAGCDRNAVAILKCKFRRYADGRLRNERLEKDRREDKKASERQAENAKKRWEPYPTKPESKALADLFNRRHTTAWSKKEIDAYRAIGKDAVTCEDVALIAGYYAVERAKGEDPKTGGHHRRDLITLLNNYHGELDRARQWEAAKMRKKERLNGQPRKIEQITPDSMDAMPDEERRAFVAQEAARFKAAMRGGDNL
jgi:uncharacterized protein YdaU (DUF1376 family)